jgi:hypothetical protein
MNLKQAIKEEFATEHEAHVPHPKCEPCFPVREIA